MTPLLEELLDLLPRDPQGFAALRDSRINEITPQLAAEARQRFKNAAQAGQGDQAAAAAMVASNLYQVLGQRHEELESLYDFHQVWYMSASTERVYQGVRQDLTELVSMAEEIGSLDLAFKAATLAADCAFFASELPSASTRKEHWLRQALDSLIMATSYGAQATRGVEFERFASLVAAFTEVFTTLDPTPDAAVQGQLRQLAQAVEELVPVDFRFPDDMDETVRHARRLALLSYRYGSPEVAQRRLEFAAGRK